MAILGLNHPLKKNFQTSSIKVQHKTTIDVFTRISCHSAMLKKKCEFIVPVTEKHPPFSPTLCAPLAQGAKILKLEIRFPRTYACKILLGSVKVCRSYSRKADFEQIHITQSCICMTAYNNYQTRGLSKHHFHL